MYILGGACVSSMSITTPSSGCPSNEILVTECRCAHLRPACQRLSCEHVYITGATPSPSRPPPFTTMRMLALAVLSFLTGSGPLLEGCTAFVVHLRAHQQHPRIRRQPPAAAAATAAAGYSASACSTTRMRYGNSIAPHGRSLSTKKFGVRVLPLPRPPSSSSPSHVPLVALSAASENKSNDGPPGDGINEAKEELLSRQAKLLISIMIDIIGISSYVLPGMGEVCEEVVLRRLVGSHLL